MDRPDIEYVKQLAEKNKDAGLRALVEYIDILEQRLKNQSTMIQAARDENRELAADNVVLKKRIAKLHVRWIEVGAAASRCACCRNTWVHNVPELGAHTSDCDAAPLEAK